MPNNTLDKFLEFIEREMRMSHIYQPLLIRMLVESGGESTLRDWGLPMSLRNPTFFWRFLLLKKDLLPEIDCSSATRNELFPVPYDPMRL